MRFCASCGKQERLTHEEAEDQGWVWILGRRNGMAFQALVCPGCCPDLKVTLSEQQALL